MALVEQLEDRGRYMVCAACYLPVCIYVPSFFPLSGNDKLDGMVDDTSMF